MRAIELWNRLGRWVNAGTKGIALVDDRGERLRLRHVFDISDTNSRSNRAVFLWAMRDGYEQAVIETLENTFGELSDKSSLPYALLCAAENAVDDNFPDYLSDLQSNLDDTVIGDAEAETVFKDALKSSVAYMALTRCGLNADEYLTGEDFQSIVHFNTLDTVSHLGAAAAIYPKCSCGRLKRR